MTEESSKNRWPILAFVGIACVLGLWFVVASEREPSESAPASASAPDSSLHLPARQLPAIGDPEAPVIDELARMDSGATARELSPSAQRVGDPPVEEQKSPDDSSAPSSPSDIAADGPVAPAAPAQRIAEGGRLSIDVASLRDGDVLALGLELSDEARGESPLAVRVVSLDGRRIETSAEPVAESGVLRLELDPEWLTQGRYMIEVKTAEKSHFPLRRYVLEIL